MLLFLVKLLFIKLLILSSLQKGLQGDNISTTGDLSNNLSSTLLSSNDLQADRQHNQSKQADGNYNSSNLHDLPSTQAQVCSSMVPGNSLTRVLWSLDSRDW